MWNKIWFFIEDFFPLFLRDLFNMLIKLVVIITLILIAIEILKALKILKILNKLLYSITKYLGISESASTPLLVGILFGITYGAGAILASYQAQEMNKKDVILVSCFLCFGHAFIEDTILFMSFGAKGYLLVLIRFFLAYIITFIINVFLKLREKTLITTKES